MQCDLLTEPMCYDDVSRLFSLLCKLVNGDQAELSLQALQIFDTDVIMMNYIVHENQRLRMIEECLNRNRNIYCYHYDKVEFHWNESIRVIGESLFDHLLDYV